MGCQRQGNAKLIKLVALATPFVHTNQYLSLSTFKHRYTHHQLLASPPPTSNSQERANHAVTFNYQGASERLDVLLVEVYTRACSKTVGRCGQRSDLALETGSKLDIAVVKEEHRGAEIKVRAAQARVNPSGKELQERERGEACSASLGVSCGDMAS